jgi:hypothetical protein
MLGTFIRSPGRYAPSRPSTGSEHSSRTTKTRNLLPRASWSFICAESRNPLAPRSSQRSRIGSGSAPRSNVVTLLQYRSEVHPRNGVWNATTAWWSRSGQHGAHRGRWPKCGSACGTMSECRPSRDHTLPSWLPLRSFGVVCGGAPAKKPWWSRRAPRRAGAVGPDAPHQTSRALPR